MIEYRSIADLDRTIVSNLPRLPRNIDLVVGVPRSGLLVAGLVALHLNLPLTDVEGFIEGRLISSGRRLYRTPPANWPSEGLRALILDDSIQTGEQMSAVRTRLEEAELPHEITYGVVYASRKAARDVDLYFEIMSESRLFEWNILDHYWLRHSCVDIDGVLCRDPTPEQNDDGPQYLSFLSDAEALYIPNVPVGWLVTCRLERYREPTEQWLRKHGVQYRELVMMNLPTAAARRARRAHAKFKADVYKRTAAQLFIESSDWQAREIANRTGKPVFCVETRQMQTGRARGIVRRVHNRLYRDIRRNAQRLYKGLARMVRLVR